MRADNAWAQLEKLIGSTGALGSYVNAAGDIVVVVPKSGSSTFTVRDAATIGLDVRVEERAFEPAEVTDVMDTIGGIAQAPGNRYTMGFGFDPRSGRIVIHTDLPEAVIGSIEEQFPGKIEYQHRDINLARLADIDPHWGGAKIKSPSFPGLSCTSGFAVNNPNGNPRMLTAGHCFLLNWTVNAWQSPGTTFGSIQRRDGYPTNDFEVIGGGGADDAPKIYVGNNVSTSSQWVSGSTTGSGSYHLYCHSGARTGEHCGMDYYIADYTLCATDDYGVYGCRLHTQVFLANEGGEPICAGDSGAPFYRYSGTVYASSVLILGIAIASDSDENCQNGTLTIIEKWSKIQGVYPGWTLQTH